MAITEEAFLQGNTRAMVFTKIVVTKKTHIGAQTHFRKENYSVDVKGCTPFNEKYNYSNKNIYPPNISRLAKPNTNSGLCLKEKGNSNMIKTRVSKIFAKTSTIIKSNSLCNPNHNTFFYTSLPKKLVLKNTISFSRLRQTNRYFFKKQINNISTANSNNSEKTINSNKSPSSAFTPISKINEPVSASVLTKISSNVSKVSSMYSPRKSKGFSLVGILNPTDISQISKALPPKQKPSISTVNSSNFSGIYQLGAGSQDIFDSQDQREEPEAKIWLFQTQLSLSSQDTINSPNVSGIYQADIGIDQTDRKDCHNLSRVDTHDHKGKDHTQTGKFIWGISGESIRYKIRGCYSSSKSQMESQVLEEVSSNPINYKICARNILHNIRSSSAYYYSDSSISNLPCTKVSSLLNIMPQRSPQIIWQRKPLGFCDFTNNQSVIKDKEEEKANFVNQIFKFALGFQLNLSTPPTNIKIKPFNCCGTGINIGIGIPMKVYERLSPPIAYDQTINPDISGEDLTSNLSRLDRKEILKIRGFTQIKSVNDKKAIVNKSPNFIRLRNSVNPPDFINPYDQRGRSHRYTGGYNRDIKDCHNIFGFEKNPGDLKSPPEIKDPHNLYRTRTPKGESPSYEREGQHLTKQKLTECDIAIVPDPGRIIYFIM
jgi:hypothetical protein